LLKDTPHNFLKPTLSLLKLSLSSKTKNQILGIDERKLNVMLRELVGSRKRMLLVQAVSQHRQKRQADVATSLNNLLSAYRAQPEKGGNVGVIQWGEREELQEIYGTYCAKVIG